VDPRACRVPDFIAAVTEAALTAPSQAQTVARTGRNAVKAVVWHDIGDIRLDTVPDPAIQEATDAVIRITRSAICGTDLHFVRGTMTPMAEGTILGHEAVGVVEAVGSDVRGFTPGDRVVVCSTIGCGHCSYCRAGYYAQCDVANPNGPDAGTSFFGGPQSTGPVNGLQAEYARVPYAAATLVRLPDAITEDQAILVSDIFPTGWFGARMAEVGRGDTVAVFGAGPVGQFAIASARQQGAGRILAVDGVQTRLALALEQNAEVIDFNAEDPVEVIKELTGGAGVDRVIDAVGVEAERPASGPAAERLAGQAAQFDNEQRETAPDAAPRGKSWIPGDAPSLAGRWAVEAVAKAGSIGIIGVYPPHFDAYPIGQAMNKNLTLRMGNCNHRRYIPRLLDLITTGLIDPTVFITQKERPASAIEAYEAFDRRDEGWLKTVLEVG
jgi:threonine dehydrogenase-like Zn-dependent dehydrogenase